jgi:hypothetical protein
MSLAFLAKKSWHTTNISNQEKVWLRQQEKEQEKKKTELLQKQMKEEREIEDMRQASGQGRPAVCAPCAPVNRRSRAAPARVRTAVRQQCVGAPRARSSAGTVGLRALRTRSQRP